MEPSGRSQQEQEVFPRWGLELKPEQARPVEPNSSSGLIPPKRGLFLWIYAGLRSGLDPAPVGVYLDSVGLNQGDLI